MKYLLIICITLIVDNQVISQTVKSIDTLALYKTAFEYIKSDSIFQCKNFRVSEFLTGSYFMFFSDSIYKSNSNLGNRATFNYNLMQLDEKNRKKILENKNNRTYIIDKNSICDNNRNFDFHKKNIHDIQIEFSPIYYNFGQNDLFIKIWLWQGKVLGGEYYIYYFVFNNLCIKSVQRKLFIEN
jgi:hypothetical protein